ncbi:MAG TPA: hypothetical protein VGI39_26295, partial [Polyangiaceae bacterium]
WAFVGMLALGGCGSATGLDALGTSSTPPLAGDLDGGSPVSLVDAANAAVDAAADATDANDLSAFGTVVAIHALDEVTGLEELSLSAAFSRYQDPNGFWFDNYLYSPACHVETLGACSWVSCLATESSVETSAGTITVQAATGPITLEPLGMGYGFAGDGGSPFIFTGTSFHVTATGAEFPAFQTPPVTMPADIHVTSPVVTPDTAPGISISKSGLPITWTGGGDGSVEVQLSEFGTPGVAGTSVRCTFPASAGSAMISPAVLSNFRAVSVPKGVVSTGILFVFPINHALASGPRWKVDVQAAGLGANFLIGTISP